MKRSRTQFPLQRPRLARDHYWQLVCFAVLLALVVSLLPASHTLHAQTPAGGGGVIGDGTPASCDNNALRTAIEAGGTVTFNCGPDPITIVSDTNVINPGVNTIVEGNESVTLDGESLRQLFYIVADGTLTLRNLNLINGGWAGLGSTIFNEGTLTLENVTISGGSQATEGTINQISGVTNIVRSTIRNNQSGAGGAVYLSGGDLNIAESTLANNSASSGGAIYVTNGRVEIRNSTLDGNSANAVGGAIYSSIPEGEGVLSLLHVTASENTDDAGQNAFHIEGAAAEPLQIQASIVYAMPSASGQACRADAGRIDTDGYNLTNSASCPFTEVGDVVDTSFTLPALADNGGATQTRLPGAGSPARDQIPVAQCTLPVDQRGTPRPQLDTCDKGAVEAVPTELTPAQLAEILPINLPLNTPIFYLGDLVIRPFPWPIFAVNPNIQAQRLEVTQAIQEADGSGVTLVAGKTTYVRFHVRKTDGVADPRVGARLWRIVGGVRTGEPLIPSSRLGLTPFIPYLTGGSSYTLDPTVTVVSNPNRNNLGDSFYFRLPKAWTAAGNLTIEAEVNPANLTNAVTESTRTDNVLPSTVTFETTPAMILRLYNVKYKVNNTVFQATETQLAEAEDWLRRAYPIHRLIVKRDVLDMTYLGHLPTCTAVNLDLMWANIFLKWGNIDTLQTRYYGLVTDGGNTKQFMRGCGGVPYGSGPTGRPGDYTNFAWDQDNDGSSFGDWYMGHEMGHVWNRAHVNCAGTEANPDTAFPMQNGTIGRRSNSDQYWGFDVALKGPVVYPPTWTDIMSYCANQWISAYTYEAIRDRLVSENSAAAAEVMGAPVDSLVVQGTISANGNDATIDNASRVNQPQALVASLPGEYTLRLLDASDGVLAEYAISPRLDTDSEQGVAQENLFMEQVPWPNGLRKIEIRKGAALLDARMVSENPPSVTVTAPSGDLTVGDAGLTVSWTASDPDGDPTTATVLYSRDNGVNFAPLRTNITATTVIIPVGELAGTTQGKVRVIVSDGANTAQDDSEGTLTIPNQAPLVQIVTPASDQSVAFGSTLELTGVAEDAETADAETLSYMWTSSLDGEYGTEADLEVVPTTPGTHTLFLTVTDVEGASTTVTRTFTLEVDALVTAAAVNATPASTTASAELGDETVQTQPFSIRNPAGESIAWNATSSAPWLTLSAPSGTTPADPEIRINPAKLGVGRYEGTVTVTSTGLEEQTIRVFLEVTGHRTLLPIIDR